MVSSTFGTVAALSSLGSVSNLHAFFRSVLRIATMYAIVWVALIGALGIYCIALAKAWRHRRILVGLLNPLNENPFAGTITTEIEVVYSQSERDSYKDQFPLGNGSRFEGLSSEEEGKKTPYTVSVSGIRRDSKTRPGLRRIPTLTRQAALAEENAEAWLYARVAFLYFIAMMLCWIPASINRLVSVISPDKIIFGLNYVSIIGLPLQGFLNALVYYVSSQTATKRVFALMGSALSCRRESIRSTKDAQRIRDSYPPRNDGGAIFQDQRQLAASIPNKKTPSKLQRNPDSNPFFAGTGKGGESVVSVPSSQEDSMKRDMNMF